MKTVRDVWHWFSTTPASLAAAFLVLGLIAGLCFGPYRPSSCTPMALQGRTIDCSLSDMLERWQTLVAAAIALIAAIPTVISIKRQLEETSRQTAALAIGTLTPIVEQLEREAAQLKPSGAHLSLLLTTLQSFPKPFPGFPRYLDVKPARAEASRIAADTEASVLRHPEPNKLYPRRQELNAIADQLHQDLFRLSAFLSIPDLDVSQGIAPVRLMLDEVTDQLELWHEKRAEFLSREFLGGEIERLRQTIDHLSVSKLATTVR